MRYSEERIWLAKYTIFLIASLGVTPNTPKKFLNVSYKTLDNTVIARYNRLTQKFKEKASGETINAETKGKTKV